MIWNCPENSQVHFLFDKRLGQTYISHPDIIRSSPAQVVKLVDTPASGAGARKGVEVQVLSWAP